jgi:hypothetical protein
MDHDRPDSRVRPVQAKELMTKTPTSVLASTGLIAGYTVASTSGHRLLGGAVAAAALGMAWESWRRHAGAGTACALAATYVAALGGSHPLAKKIGAWPSVLTVAAATAVAAHCFGDRRAR